MSAQGKDAAPSLGPADGDKPRFAARMPDIGEHERTRCRQQNSLDLRKGNAVLLTFAAIATIPFKPDNPHIREHQGQCVLMYVHLSNRQEPNGFHAGIRADAVTLHSAVMPGSH
jgi:hypothetical protein